VYVLAAFSKQPPIIFYTKIWLNFGIYTEPTRELGLSYAVQRFQIHHPSLISKIDCWYLNFVSLLHFFNVNLIFFWFFTLLLCTYARVSVCRRWNNWYRPYWIRIPFVWQGLSGHLFGYQSLLLLIDQGRCQNNITYFTERDVPSSCVAPPPVHNPQLHKFNPHFHSFSINIKACIYAL
jgi:hypothetical protein